MLAARADLQHHDDDAHHTLVADVRSTQLMDFCHKDALYVQALAKMRHLEDAVAPQCQENDKQAMLLEPPHQADAAIGCIQAECNLRAAPLDAILAKIAWEDITPDPPGLLSSASLALPLPTVDGQLQMVHKCVQPCCCTG